MEGREDWLDEISADQQYDWTRPTPATIETMLRPDLPCRIRQALVGAHPVLYVAIGTNGTHNYWQWATVDRLTSEPLPRKQALADFWRLTELAMITSKSRIVPRLMAT